jgi:hypothetical protein
MKIHITLLVVVFHSFVSFSQSSQLYNRTAIEGELDCTKKFSVLFGLQSRWNLSTTSFDKLIFKVEPSFTINKSIEINAAYRNSAVQNSNFMLDGKRTTFANRFSFGFRLNSSKFKKMDTYLRLVYLSRIQFEDFKFKRDQWYWRNRITVKAKIKNNLIKPYFSIESLYRKNQFYYLMDNDFVTEGMVNEIRYMLGTELNFNKRNTMDVGLMLRDYQTSKATNFVLNVTYRHNFTQNKKRKK